MLTLEEKNELLERVTTSRIQRRYLEIIGELSHMPRAELLVEPELGYSLACARNAQGEYPLALVLVQETATVCRAAGDDRLYRRCLLLEAAIDVETGSLSTAEINFNHLIHAAAASRDDKLLAAATMNLGVVFALRCEWHESLTTLCTAKAAYQLIGDELGWADCSYNTGLAYKELGELETARRYFDQAWQVYHIYAVPNLLGLVEVERALLFSAAGDFALASIALQRAMEVVRRYGDLRLAGEAEYVSGQLLRARGKYGQARKALVGVIQRAEFIGSRFLEAEAYMALAEVELHLGDTAAARQCWCEAERMYSLLGSAARAESARMQRQHHIGEE